MTQANGRKHVVLTLGEIALINFLVDNARVGYDKINAIAALVESLPPLPNPSTYGNAVTYYMSDEQLDWIKTQVAINLERINVPARFSAQCIALAGRVTEEETTGQPELGEEMENE